MSTILYGALTRKREEAPSGKSRSAAAPAVRTYADALAALVPAEVLAAHAVILPYAVETRGAGAETTYAVSDPGVLVWAFWALVVLSGLFYLVGRRRTAWEPWDWARLALPPIAFTLWTMLQQPSAFEPIAEALGLSSAARTVGAVLGALLVGLAASALAVQADERPPPP